MPSAISEFASKMHVLISKLRPFQQSCGASALRRDLSAQFSSMSLFALDRAVVLKECEPRWEGHNLTVHLHLSSSLCALCVLCVHYYTEDQVILSLWKWEQFKGNSIAEKLSLTHRTRVTHFCQSAFNVLDGQLFITLFQLTNIMDLFSVPFLYHGFILYTFSWF